MTGHKDVIYGAQLLPDGKRALSWSGDDTLRLWNLAAGTPVGASLTGHDGPVTDALLLPSGNQALSWSYDRTLRLWDLDEGCKLGQPLTGHDDRVNGVLLLRGGRQALSWSHDWTVRLWDLLASKELGCFYGEGRVQTLIDCGKNRFFAGDGTGRVYFLELHVRATRETSL
jgi:WD40 repeat protein